MIPQSSMEALLRAAYPSLSSDQIASHVADHDATWDRILAWHLAETDATYKKGFHDGSGVAQDAEHDRAVEAAVLEKAKKIVRGMYDTIVRRGGTLSAADLQMVPHEIEKLFSPGARSALEERDQRVRDEALETAALAEDALAAMHHANSRWELAASHDAAAARVRALKSSAGKEE